MRLTGGQYLSARHRRAARERRVLAGVGRGPTSSTHDVGRGVRRVAQRAVVDRPLPRLDRADLVADRDHRVAEAVELGEVLRLGRLDHQRARHRERHRRRVEAVVDEALGDVVDGDAGGLRDRAQVEDALVRDQARRARCRAPGSAARAAARRSWRSGSRPASRASRPSAPIIAMYAHEIGRIPAEPHGGTPAMWPAGQERRARCARTATGPTPGPPPPCGMQNVLCRLRCDTSAPNCPGLARPTSALRLAPSRYTWPPCSCTTAQTSRMLRLEHAVRRRVRDHQRGEVGRRARAPSP